MKKLIVVTCLGVLLYGVTAHGQSRFSNDPYFPTKRTFNAGFYTTYRGTAIAAPVMIGEIVYGVSDRVSLSVVAGTTGTLGLLGIRMAAALHQQNNFRLLLRVSSVYYPERRGTFLFDKSNQTVMPWMLSMGFIDAEWRMKNGLRWAIGAGALETHCVNGMMNLLSGGKWHQDAVLALEVFNTVQTSLSVPLSSRLTLRPEVIAAFKGMKLVTDDKYKVGPLTIYLNLVYQF
ncbi:hypothetical protein BH10BAC4_BH10BAC4_16520 [soil metagenome]